MFSSDRTRSFKAYVTSLADYSNNMKAYSNKYNDDVELPADGDRKWYEQNPAAGMAGFFQYL